MSKSAIDIQTLLALLARVDSRKPYGTELFNALARLTVSVALEAVCLRAGFAQLGQQRRDIQVYLCQRVANDTTYPGQWHCPGSVMRPGETEEEVFHRLGTREFGAKLQSWEFVDRVNHSHEKRGHFMSLVYLCVLGKEENERGAWFDLEKLPTNTVLHHKTTIIPVAVGKFLAQNAQLYT